MKCYPSRVLMTDDTEILDEQIRKVPEVPYIPSDSRVFFWRSAGIVANRRSLIMHRRMPGTRVSPSRLTFPNVARDKGGGSESRRTFLASVIDEACCLRTFIVRV
ncbi:hypothetical protein PUN28_009444 [Cardiocondyla obscurior]|uniref:Uncharacterized protein n=1 Tax=Cardiocondyla obscurior TaxID=286306 RepID=A0AAW2FTS6_9HYME